MVGRRNRIWLGLLVLVLAAALVGCGGSTPAPGDSGSQGDAQQEAKGSEEKVYKVYIVGTEPIFPVF